MPSSQSVGTSSAKRAACAITLHRFRLLLECPQERTRTGRFVLDGIRPLARCVDYEHPVEQLLVSRPLLRSTFGQILVRKLRAAGTPVTHVTPEAFRQLSRTPRASGLMGITRQHLLECIPRSNPKRMPCWLAVTAIQSQGNLGTLIRTAHASGAQGLIVVGSQCDPFGPEVVRASMGSLLAIQVVRVADEESLLRQAGRLDLELIGASGDGAVALQQAGFARGCIILLGHERRGLSQRQRAICSRLVRIPTQPDCDSLNIAIAGSLLLYEVRRWQT